MARSCSVCDHPDHLAIDQALLGAGVERLSQREVALRFGLSRASVQRHAVSHVSAVLRAVQGQAGTLHAETMLTQLADAYERIIRLADRAEQAGDLRTAVSAVREIRGTVETFAKVGLAMSQVSPPQESQRVDLDNLIDAALRKRMAGESTALVAGHDPDDDVVDGVIVD
jgi:DNA-binding transcriptional regulator LsrR (DeoR family)